MKIQIKKCRGGWYFRMVSRNGRILAHSEVYKSKQGAEDGAESIINSIVEGQYSWE